MKGTALIPTSLVKRLSVAVAAAALVVSGGALAADAQAGIAFNGGSASVDVFCHLNFGGNTTRLWGVNASDRQIHFQLYIQNHTYPHLSGWQDWRVLPARGSGYFSQTFDYGQLVAMRTGVISVYVHYALWNGYRWETYGEWTPFQVPLGFQSGSCAA
jgi:hypothetical protein